MAIDRPAPPPRRRGPLVLLAAAVAGAVLGGGAFLLSERLHAPMPGAIAAPTPAPLPAPPSGATGSADRGVSPSPQALPGERPGEGAGARTERDPAAAVWRCPMHPDVARDGPGRCPICGMALVKDAAAAEHPAGAQDHR